MPFRIEVDHRRRTNRETLAEALSIEKQLGKRIAGSVLGTTAFAKLSKEFLFRTIKATVEHPENLDKANAILENGGSIIFVITDTGSLTGAAYGKPVLERIPLKDHTTVFIADKHRNKERNPVEGSILEGWGRIVGIDMASMVQIGDNFYSEQEAKRRNTRLMITAIRKLNEGGHILVIAPTGTRTKTELIEALPGVAAIFAGVNEKVWAVPLVAHHGKIKPFTTNTVVSVGEPFNCKAMVEQIQQPGMKRDEINAAVLRAVMLKVASELPDAERGPYRENAQPA